MELEKKTEMDVKYMNVSVIISESLHQPLLHLFIRRYNKNKVVNAKLRLCHLDSNNWFPGSLHALLFLLVCTGGMLSIMETVPPFSCCVCQATFKRYQSEHKLKQDSLERSKTDLKKLRRKSQGKHSSKYELKENEVSPVPCTHYTLDGFPSNGAVVSMP